MNYKRLLILIRKEFILIRRDPGALIAIIIFPLITLALYAYAIELKPKNLSTALLLNDYSLQTQQFLTAIENTQYFKIKYIVRNESEAEDLMRKSKIKVFIKIPNNFTSDLLKGIRPEILVVADSLDQPAIISQAVSSLEQLKQLLYTDIRANINKPSESLFNIVIHNKYNPEFKTETFLIPGVIVFIVMLMVMQLMINVSFRDRDAGTYEFLQITPIQPEENLVSLIVSYVMLGMLWVTMAICLSLILFDLKITGSILGLFVSLTLYVMAETMLGLLIAEYSKTMLEGNEYSKTPIMIYIVFSGFFYPTDSMPSWAKIISECLPMSHQLRITKGIFGKGESFIDILPELLPIVIFIIIITWLFKMHIRK
jgi:ABC-2 type transport system permease protein